MTTPSQNAQRLLAANYAAWAAVSTAWSKAFTDLWAAVAEWAVDEQEFLGVGETVTYLQATRDVTLRANLSSVLDRSKAPEPVPQEAIRITPASILADESASGPVRVVIKVDMGETSAPAYKGVLVDQDGTVVDTTVYVPMMSG